MVCAHLNGLEKELLDLGIKETFRGAAWSKHPSGETSPIGHRLSGYRMSIGLPRPGRDGRGLASRFWDSWPTVPAVFLMALTGCGKHLFRPEPAVASRAAAAVAENLDFGFRRTGDSDSVEIKLLDPEGYTLGFLRLTPSARPGFATRVQSEFRENDFMPKHMLRGFYLECMEQQMQLDSGIRAPHANRSKSFYKYQLGNLLSPSFSAYYAVRGNPFYAPYAKYPAIATQGVLEFGAIMTAIGYFDADTKGQREGYLDAFLFFYGVSRGIGMVLGWNLKYYEKVQGVPYDLSEMSFSF